MKRRQLAQDHLDHLKEERPVGIQCSHPYEVLLRVAVKVATRLSTGLRAVAPGIEDAKKPYGKM